MAYFSFNYITPPPNDETVDPVTQLNNNVIEIENKTKGFTTRPNTVVNPPLGTEAFYPGTDNYRIAVWDGTDWARSLSHNVGWGPWQALNCRAPVVPRPDYPPVVRVNSMLGQVELSGGVIHGAAAPAWPNSWVELFIDSDFGPEFQPPAGYSMHMAATGQITTAGGYAAAVVWAEAIGTTRTAIRAQYQGDAGGGNFIMLNGVRWWIDGHTD